MIHLEILIFFGEPNVSVSVKIQQILQFVFPWGHELIIYTFVPVYWFILVFNVSFSKCSSWLLVDLTDFPSRHPQSERCYIGSNLNCNTKRLETTHSVVLGIKPRNSSSSDFTFKNNNLFMLFHLLYIIWKNKKPWQYTKIHVQRNCQNTTQVYIPQLSTNDSIACLFIIFLIDYYLFCASVLVTMT